MLLEHGIRGGGAPSGDAVPAIDPHRGSKSRATRSVGAVDGQELVRAHSAIFAVVIEVAIDCQLRDPTSPLRVRNIERDVGARKLAAGRRKRLQKSSNGVIEITNH